MITTGDLPQHETTTTKRPAFSRKHCLLIECQIGYIGRDSGAMITSGVKALDRALANIGVVMDHKEITLTSAELLYLTRGKTAPKGLKKLQTLFHERGYTAAIDAYTLTSLDDPFQKPFKRSTSAKTAAPAENLSEKVRALEKQLAAARNEATTHADRVKELEQQVGEEFQPARNFETYASLSEALAEAGLPTTNDPAEYLDEKQKPDPKVSLISGSILLALVGNELTREQVMGKLAVMLPQYGSFSRKRNSADTALRDLATLPLIKTRKVEQYSLIDGLVS